MDELRDALTDSLQQTKPVLIDIKVLPKTMVHGYGDWWRVGVAQVSENKKVNEIYEKVMKPHYDAARKY